ncbi:MAG TPA: Ig-like domain-containing protein, partial [Agriterribacter sp.]|nr:Ig-like domain-containing protein [Agriterribacter sp.]
MINSKRSRSLWKYGYVPFLWISILLASCNQKEKITGVDPAFSRYVEGYTSGVISKAAVIRIRLTAETPSTHVLNEALKEPMFSFTPSVKGKAYWVDARTIEFKPDEYLKPGTLYTVHFKLNKATAVPDAFATFTFNVQAVAPGFYVKENGLKAAGNSKEMMLLSGTVETADIESSATVEKLLAAVYGDKPAAIKWEHNESTRIHRFTIEDIKRGTGASTLQLQWNGAPLGLKEKGGKEVDIPPVGDFKVLNIRAIQETESYVLVQFSGAIATGQQLNGLITVSNQTNLSYSIDGSEVKLYVPDNFDGNYTITVHEGIQSVWNSKL